MACSATIGQLTFATFAARTLTPRSVARSRTGSNPALSYTLTCHSGEYPASLGSVATTLCTCSVPGSVLNPDPGPPPVVPGFTLNVTKIGDNGTTSPVNGRSTNVKSRTVLPSYHPVPSEGDAPFSRSRAVEPSGTIGEFTM